ncbi:hypothetical protein LY28_03380 [Ruminiclostridium sufflavum DSM 19573]|uniref:Firmicu-CTERM sorting domain-containing protein n=1 Tax=Ruminiclostridium sufflavum DSM 19573 TaxID=1121337 RepID=A0A318XIS5_9FIRM|nr:Firmicu-CTERM sorting domain-containing protein [Ruminiclostridium sufflavum]PYG85020.1 hypothetical protein LY28_03380 [Ruminiclostridium sufflavum DSM 19573]
MLSNRIKHTCTIIAAIFLVLLPSVVVAETQINIDGYFDDWTDKPHTEFYYGTYDNSDYEKVAIFSDNTSLYGHIKMSDLDGRYDSFIMNLYINNLYNVQFVIMCTDNNKEITWDKTIKDLSPGTHFDLAVFYNQDYTALLGDAALVINNSNHNPGDNVEFSIDYNKIRKYCDNIPVSEIKTITLTCASLGSQSVSLAGTSTAPFTGILVTLFATGLVLICHKYRKIRKIA